jgi:hypothetical protein
MRLAYSKLKERTKKSIIVFMTSLEIKTRMHERIEHLSEAQLKKLNDIFEQEFNADLSETDQPKKRNLVGSMKGFVTYMADDFNEPLDDFKEYMPD